MDKSKNGKAKDFSNSTQGNPGNRDRGIAGPDGVRDQDSREQGADAAQELKRAKQQNDGEMGNRGTGNPDQANPGQDSRDRDMPQARDVQRTPQAGQQQGNREIRNPGNKK
jgi:hypothetical protein